MKLHYYPDTDRLYIGLSPKTSVDSKAIADGLVVGFDGDGNVVGIDIDHASKKVDLRTLETHALPAMAIRIA